MSTLQMSLRLGGNLPSPEELTETLGMKPTEFRRRGDRISKKISPELLKAAADSGLSIQISILVMLDDYVEEEEESSL